MHFAHESDVLAWFDGQKRVLTPQFLGAIPWHAVKDHPFDPSLTPVLLYMRDVESYTGIYFDQLRRSPTWKNPSIRRFMERWNTEEPLHGDLLNRFLVEAGYTSSERWFDESRDKIPERYFRAKDRDAAVIKCFGQHFAAVHMTWGAINEFSTLTGYQRLWQRADHPVLTVILQAIAKEEARHSFFYWSVARILLAGSAFRRILSRTIVDRFWAPVGEGAKTPEESDQMISALFKGEEGVGLMDRQVNQRIAQLPGFAGFTTVTRRIARTALQ